MEHPPTPAVDHVCISVADLDAQRQWYSASFGFTEFFPFQAPHLGVRGVCLATPDGFSIELLEQSGSRTGPRPPAMAESLMTQGFAHLCLRVPDVDAFHAHLLIHGASERMAPKASPQPNVRMSYVADPEGNLIELLDRPPVYSGR